MTEPIDPDPHDGRRDDVDALDAATVDRLRALLRDEPIADDDLARERRIRTALAAADEDRADAPAATPVTAPRRVAGGRSWLAAAGVLAVVGLGGVVALAVSDSRSDGQSAESADAAFVDGSDDELDAAGGAAADAAPAEEAERQDAATTTTAVQVDASAQSADAGAAPNALDLGTYADEAALRAAIDAVRTRPADGAFRSPLPMEVDCLGQVLASGRELLGVAEVAGRAVVVVVDAGALDVLDAATCTGG